MERKEISKSVLKRLPGYLAYLKNMPEDSALYISATALANALGMGEVQVRKDLASIATGGKPKTGYCKGDLINALETYLGYKSVDNAVIIGAGKLGMALFDYGGFEEYGLNIVAAFDNNISKVGVNDKGRYIYPLADFPEFCRQVNVKIGIITVPASAAQETCDLLCDNGIRAIWSFAPIHLNAKEDTLIQYENMAATLAILCGHTKEKE